MDGQTQPVQADAPVQLPLLELENLTINNNQSIDKLKDELKSANEMLADMMNSDQVYKNNAEGLKESKKALEVVKNNIMRRPEAIALSNKVKEIRNEIKEKKSATSDYALEYARMSGKNEIERDGVTYEIVTVAKLVKRAA